MIYRVYRFVFLYCLATASWMRATINRVYRWAISLSKKARKARIELFLGFLGVLALVLFIAILWRGFDWPGANWIDCWLGTSQLEAPKWEAIKTLAQALFGTAIAFGIYVAYRRVLASDNANEQQVFNEATAKLGDKSASVRLGGVYALDKLAGSNKDYLTRIAEILCAHLRETTQKEEYQEKYKDKPSNEIQSLAKVLSELNKELNILNSRKEKNGNFDFLRLDLSASYLVGVNLGNACLKDVNLRETNLQGASLDGAQMQRAILSQAQMQEALLVHTEMQGTSCHEVQMQGAHLHGAQMQRASLWRAQMQGAILYWTRLQGAHLPEAKMQGIILFETQMQGTTLIKTQMQGAKLVGTQLQGATLWEAQLQGADLYQTKMQGATLNDTQIQGAKLSKVDLRGAYVSSPVEYLSLPERIKKRQGKEADLGTVIFSGGLKQEDTQRIREQLTECQKNEWMMKEEVDRINTVLKEHQDKPPSRKLPKDSEAITGSYTKKEADAIIAAYEKAMAGVKKI